MRVHEFQRFPDTPSDGRSLPRDSALEKEIARAGISDMNLVLHAFARMIGQASLASTHRGR